MDGDVIFLLARSDIARYSYTTSVVRVVSRFRCLGCRTPGPLSFLCAPHAWGELGSRLDLGAGGVYDIIAMRQNVCLLRCSFHSWTMD